MLISAKCTDILQSAKHLSTNIVYPVRTNKQIDIPKEIININTHTIFKNMSSFLKLSSYILRFRIPRCIIHDKWYIYTVYTGQNIVELASVPVLDYWVRFKEPYRLWVFGNFCWPESIKSFKEINTLGTFFGGR